MLSKLQLQHSGGYNWTGGVLYQALTWEHNDEISQWKTNLPCTDEI